MLGAEGLGLLVVGSLEPSMFDAAESEMRNVNIGEAQDSKVNRKYGARADHIIFPFFRNPDGVSPGFVIISYEVMSRWFSGKHAIPGRIL